MSARSDNDVAVEISNDQPDPVSTPPLNSTPDGDVDAQGASISINQGSGDDSDAQGPSVSNNKDSIPDQGVPLQQIIRDINRNQKLSTEEKRAEVQLLYQKSIENLLKPQNLETEDDQPSFHDEKNKILGCKHYKRSCKVQCSECLKFYTCRHCHNAAENHQFNRRKTSVMLCMKCMTKQPIGQTCNNPECGAKMARYYCEHCEIKEILT